MKNCKTLIDLAISTYAYMRGNEVNQLRGNIGDAPQDLSIFLVEKFFSLKFFLSLLFSDFQATWTLQK